MINKQILNRSSFVLDALLFALLIFSAQWNWFLALLITESLMWFVRTIWLSPMLFRFIGKRFLNMIPILFSVVALGFALLQLAPGDIFTQLVLNPDIRPEDVENLRRTFSLDKPWHIQFLKYLWNVLHGDFGLSVTYKIPVFDLVGQRAVNTIILSVTSILLAWGLSIPFGIYSATHQYKASDQAISILAFFGLAIPNFFLAFLLIYLISKSGNWLPLGGMYSINSGDMNTIQRFFDLIKHLILPVFVLATSAMAGLTRYMRANMLDIMGQQYIVTARAKGLKESKVVYKHALRNAINPMITIFGFQLSGILGGAALTEQVLAWPGLGKLMLAALLQQDSYLVIGSFFYSVLLLVVGNLLADILLAVVDPRIRIS